MKDCMDPEDDDGNIPYARKYRHQDLPISILQTVSVSVVNANVSLGSRGKVWESVLITTIYIYLHVHVSDTLEPNCL